MAGEIMTAGILKMLVLPALEQVSYPKTQLSICNSIFLKMRLLVLRAQFVLLEELMLMKVALKSAMMEYGEQFVMISGVVMMA